MIAASDDMCAPDTSQYFRLGREALALLQDATSRAGGKKVESILDLPCGYGRVARWLRTAYPEARLTVSDIQGPAVAFCVEHLGATGVQATIDGRHWEALPGPYDLIWCGSLLTHLDRVQWISHLRRFTERLAPQGVLVFTTHGLLALDWLQSGEKDYGLPDDAVARLRASAIGEGFGYVDYADTPGYGISVSQPRWVLELIARETDLHVLDLRVAGWDGHQDVVVCMHRPPAK
jgi:SAM-dependent methyltransferase